MRLFLHRGDELLGIGHLGPRGGVERDPEPRRERGRRCRAKSSALLLVELGRHGERGVRSKRGISPRIEGDAEHSVPAHRRVARTDASTLREPAELLDPLPDRSTVPIERLVADVSLGRLASIDGGAERLRDPGRVRLAPMIPPSWSSISTAAWLSVELPNFERDLVVETLARAPAHSDSATKCAPSPRSMRRPSRPIVSVPDRPRRKTIKVSTAASHVATRAPTASGDFVSMNLRAIRSAAVRASIESTVPLWSVPPVHAIGWTVRSACAATGWLPTR